VRRRKKLLWIVLPVLALVLLVGLPSLRPGVYLPAHRHCIKFAGMQLHSYADAHGGRYPDHPAGYGDALLLMDEETYNALTGPGYDPAVFREAKAAGRGLPEEACGRVYVRGLTTKVSSRVALLFDKRSTPGGDHCHWPLRLWARRGREVGFPDGSFQFVRDSEWPAFAAEQTELLVGAGIPRAEAERLYAQVIP
jgi:hypothetical protein